MPFHSLAVASPEAGVGKLLADLKV